MALSNKSLRTTAVYILSIYWRRRGLRHVFRLYLRTTRQPHWALRLFVIVRRIEHSARHWRWRRAIGSIQTYTAQVHIKYIYK